MNAVSLATRPQHNITVSASAGSGKTWMLVTRIIRLLLADNPADGILAITFTRKAAAEMQQRLMDRLFALASADEATLTAMLENMAIDPAHTDVASVRGLYERLLHSRQQPTITTFHAFSQQLLRRFPLEADVPAAFDLVEQDALLINEAWDALMNEVTRQPGGPVAQALASLYELTGGVHNTRNALYSFLSQRSDWWAMTQDQRQPVRYAQSLLQDLLAVPTSVPTSADFFAEHAQAIIHYAGLLRLHDTATNLNNAALAEACVSNHDYAGLRSLFFTQANTVRVFKTSKTSTASRGIDNEQQLLALHEALLQACEQRDDLLSRVHNANLNNAWYCAGHRLLEHYQAIKQNRRILDFSDLEWKAYCLLNTQDNAHWIQYKLDQRIDHLLVDEFQDTNPVQWRLLLPLLEELAAAESERQRSVFLVGDAKQAIYGFRRADAGLFDQARQWLADRVDAEDVPLSTSRRSSPAIIDFINTVFSAGELHDQLPDYLEHSTYQQQLWGRVELLPLFSLDETLAEDTPNRLRDPLVTAHPPAAIHPASVEAEAIAARIRTLIDSGMLVEDHGKERPVSWSDIMILLRTRTAASSYETALRQAGIPYFGTERGTLFNCMEIQDMLALLDCLLTPYNNLAIARVLRSPVFSLDNDELAAIALQARQHNCGWFDAMQRLADAPGHEQLGHAWQLLADWHSQIGKLPVHDLLDRVYSEASILERFQAACPPHQRRRVHANLVRFLVLALEIDSGRYPSFEQFRNHLRNLHKYAAQQMHNAQTSGDDNRVQIMTIHEAKGLEAPVVFLVDSAKKLRDRSAWNALVNWRADQERPDALLLLPDSKQRNRLLQDFQTSQRLREQREEVNLLYVALTRARHMLVISGNSRRTDRPAGWYQQLLQQLEPVQAEIATRGYRHASGEPGFDPHQSSQAQADTPSPVPAIQLPAGYNNNASEIAPSQQHSRLEMDDNLPLACIDEADDLGGRMRGVILHNLLERLCNEKQLDDARLQALSNQYGLDMGSAFIKECVTEAMGVFTASQHQQWFDDSGYRLVRNETPLVYIDPASGRVVNGVIDRLLVSDDKVIIIDYKTHRQANAQTIPVLTDMLREQLDWYRKGIALLYPGLPIECWLLFTHCNQAARVI